jgi:DNA-binding HxlR family transcriptional regulator
MLSKDELPACPVATCFQLFGNKWKVYVIQHLIERPYGFNELKRSIEGISQKVLSANLKEMEAAELITRTVIPDSPIRTEYALSEVGKSLMPLIDSMVAWGQNYQQLCNAAENIPNDFECDDADNAYQ